MSLQLCMSKIFDVLFLLKGFENLLILILGVERKFTFSCTLTCLFMFFCCSLGNGDRDSNFLATGLSCVYNLGFCEV